MVNPLEIKMALYINMPSNSNNICPATTFANNRNARLNIRKTYDTNSMNINAGDKIRGNPIGTNDAKN